MTYTFSKRRELNKRLREALPGYQYEEEKQGVPRMHIDRLPDGAEEAMSTHEVELMAYRHWEAHRRPMPVFLLVDYGKEVLIEVNFVSHQSDKSLEEAARYIGRRKLFVLESLI